MKSVKTNRSLLAYIILTAITFGLYGIWFVYKMKEDVNTICREDGKETPGLIVLLLLSLITCGIYSFVWYYQICERIANYQIRRGMSTDINGAKYLLWTILGCFLCYIGPFVAIHLLCKGLNSIALRYTVEAANGGSRRPSSNNSSNSGSSNSSGSGSRGRLSDFADSNSGSDSFGNGSSGRADSFGNGSSGGSDSFGSNRGSSSNSGKTDSFGNPIN